MGNSPVMLMADANGNIIDNPRLLMLAARGGKWFVPSAAELVPMPAESELFMLPSRQSAGFNPRTGKVEKAQGMAVAAFAAPAYTLSAHPAYYELPNAPVLPLFAYGAVGYARGKFWICAQKTDNDPRQKFRGIDVSLIAAGCDELLAKWPENRLVGHIINNCVRRYDCPAARNFALGRYEAPLPTSRTCNARCIGCISAQGGDSPIAATPQCRLDFIPSAEEIAQVMRIHEGREKERPVYSFGQGCEGDPLMNAPLLAESIRLFRSESGQGKGLGTVNCNTNASSPQGVAMLAEAGLTSMRISLNSCQPENYEAYYRPVNYNFGHVRQSARLGRQAGVFVSLNLLFFPGITDTPAELEALSAFCAENGISMIQWRNLNIDPGWYESIMAKHAEKTVAIGLKNFMDKLRKACPWLVYGYFNPWLGTRAAITAPAV